MVFISKLKKLWALPIRTKLFFLLCFSLLPLFQLSVSFLPLKTLLKLYNLRPAPQDSKEDILRGGESTERSTTHHYISYLVIRTSQLHFFPCRCFAQALLARLLLLHHGEQPKLYLGASLGQDQLCAHAWLECGGITITGKEERNGYHELACFL